MSNTGRKVSITATEASEYDLQPLALDGEFLTQSTGSSGGSKMVPSDWISSDTNKIQAALDIAPGSYVIVTELRDPNTGVLAFAMGV